MKIISANLIANLARYIKGGYCPVAVGEFYLDRYQVIRKLGWGVYSTVWLAWDSNRSYYVALKSEFKIHKCKKLLQN